MPTRTPRNCSRASCPDEVLIFTLPSRYCLPDVLGAEAWSRFGAMPPGYRRVQAICDYVNNHLKFSYGTSDSRTTAADVHASGYGVCRDFTHLAVSFCRALNIPARYVFGYLPEIEVPKRGLPMDFAAWMEVYLGDRWWTFDPRNNERRKGRVLIGRGRDAGDVAMATTFGAPYLESHARHRRRRDRVQRGTGASRRVARRSPGPAGRSWLGRRSAPRPRTSPATRARRGRRPPRRPCRRAEWSGRSST